MSRSRYWFTLTIEVPAPTLADAIERALRLMRPRVRANLRQTVAYQGSYRGSWFSLSRAEAPPGDRVNLKARRRALKPARKEAAPREARTLFSP